MQSLYIFSLLSFFGIRDCGIPGYFHLYFTFKKGSTLKRNNLLPCLPVKVYLYQKAGENKFVRVVSIESASIPVYVKQ